jgi:RNA polymerase sigma-70 factor (ECF subfamily)
MKCSATHEYAQLVTKNQRKIFWYILSLLPHWTDAEEALQETNLVLWQKAEQYDRERDFLPWACQIARYEVLKMRERRQRRFPCLSDLFDAEVGAEALAAADSVDELSAALADCLAKLRSHDRDLVERRYRLGGSTKIAAAEIGRSVDVVYKSLQRINRLLFQCISQTLAR